MTFPAKFLLSDLIEICNFLFIDSFIGSFFHLHKCSNEDITWKHSLESKIYQLTSKNEALSNSYDDITKTCVNTVECFINIRIAMDLPNNKVTRGKIYVQQNIKKNF